VSMVYNTRQSHKMDNEHKRTRSHGCLGRCLGRAGRGVATGPPLRGSSGGGIAAAAAAAAWRWHLGGIAQRRGGDSLWHFALALLVGLFCLRWRQGRNGRRYLHVSHGHHATHHAPRFRRGHGRLRGGIKCGEGTIRCRGSVRYRSLGFGGLRDGRFGLWFLDDGCRAVTCRRYQATDHANGGKITRKNDFIALASFWSHTHAAPTSVAAAHSHSALAPTHAHSIRVTIATGRTLGHGCCCCCCFGSSGSSRRNGWFQRVQRCRSSRGCRPCHHGHHFGTLSRLCNQQSIAHHAKRGGCCCRNYSFGRSQSGWGFARLVWSKNVASRSRLSRMLAQPIQDTATSLVTIYNLQ
jgi:hypothetical protein